MFNIFKNPIVAGVTSCFGILILTVLLISILVTVVAPDNPGSLSTPLSYAGFLVAVVGGFVVYNNRKDT